MILSAGYGLRLYREVMFGTIVHENLQNISDMNRREMGLLTVLAFMALYLGVNPSPTLAVFRPATDYVLTRFEQPMEMAGQALAQQEAVIGSLQEGEEQ
ncbi:MAG: hypothetical protein AAF723_10385, partial [Pseudomonadota bacterium]